MIFFLLLAVLLLVSGRPVSLAAISFGMALSFKVVPIIFGPAFFFYLSDFKKRAYFVSIVGLVFIAGSLPYITMDPLLIFREVFGYTSFPGRWGWTLALYAATHGEGIYSVVVRVGTYILLALLTYRSYLMNRKSKPSLYLQVGSLAFLFMSFTTGWGTHYMAWLDPFAIGVGLMPGLLYYSASGAMLIRIYFVREHEPTRLIGICWIAVLIVTSIYLRRTRPNRNL